MPVPASTFRRAAGTMDPRRAARPAAARPVDCDPTTFGRQQATRQIVLPARRMGKAWALAQSIAAAQAMGYRAGLTPRAAFLFAPAVAQKTLNTTVAARAEGWADITGARP